MYKHTGNIYGLICICRKEQDNKSLSAKNLSDRMQNSYESKIDVLHSQWMETYKYISINLDSDFQQSYKELLENRLCKKFYSKISTNKRKELRVITDCLLNNYSFSPANFEIFKSFIDCLTKPDIQDQDRTDSAIEQMNSDILQEQKYLKTLVDFIAKDSITPEQFTDLKCIINNLSNSSVSSDYVDKSVKENLEHYLNEMEKYDTIIKNIEIDFKEIENIEKNLQKFVKENQIPNDERLLNEKLRKQEQIIQAIKNENNSRKMECQKLRTEIEKKFNTGIINIIYKLLFDQMP